MRGTKLEPEMEWAVQETQEETDEQVTSGNWSTGGSDSDLENSGKEKDVNIL